MGKGAPCIPNIEAVLAMGLDPKTGLPLKMSTGDGNLKVEFKKLFRIVDEQDAVSGRYQWYNLPNGISSQELERMLYYKGQLCFFYHEPLDQFFFMPYALEGTIDFYGRYNYIHPLPYYYGTEDEKKQNKQQADYLSTLKLKVLKDIKLDEVTYQDLVGTAVILRDYTPQYGQNLIPRATLQDAVLDIEADLPCYLRTALKNSTGVQGMRVNDQSAYSNVLAANDAMDKAALTGERLIPIISAIEMQDLSGGNVLKAEEYLESLQAIDNLRLGFLGLDNGGLFQKQAHILESEQAMNAGKAKSTLQDGLTQRQHFCDIVNSYTGLGIWCDTAEIAIDADMDGDGLVDNNDSEMSDAGSTDTVGGESND